MDTRINSHKKIFSPRKFVPMIFIISGLVSSCSTATPNNPEIGNVEPSQAGVADVSTPVSQAFDSTDSESSSNDAAEWFSSDELGLCFSYPQGYQQVPNTGTVEIVAPDHARPEDVGLFWLEISDSYDRTAERIANEDMTLAAGVDVGRWTVTLDGEQAVVLDGMPGQNFQRRVYVVRDQTLYILAFMPTRSENKAADDQMEALYTAITRSWSWSPCSGE